MKRYDHYIDGRFVPSVSPDGSRVAYLTSGEGPHVLFLSDLVTATWAASPVGTRSERSPGVVYTAQEGAHGFWSPDSRWLVVAVDGVKPPADVQHEIRTQLMLPDPPCIRSEAAAS